MRYLLVLLAGVLLGFLLGRASREEGGSRGGRGAELPRAAPAPEPQAPPAPSASAADAPAPVAPEPAPQPADDGTGWLEIDWTGPQVWDDVHLIGRDLRGEWQEIDLPAPDGLVRLELAAGRYRFTAMAKGDLSPREWSVDLGAGGVTRLAPGSEAPQPIPAGLARLDFTVLDVEGRPLSAAQILVTGRGPEGEMTTQQSTNAAGRGRLHLRPGHYRLSAGATETEVQLAAGQAAEIAFPATGLGEVHVDLRALRGFPTLSPVQVKHEAGERLCGYRSGVFFHVKPGRYELGVYAGRKTPVVLGQVDVRAGEIVRWEESVPAGELDVILHYPANERAGLGTWPLEVTPLDGDGEPFLVGMRQWGGREGPEADEEWSLCRVTHLLPGRYRARFVGKRWLPAAAEVYVPAGGARPRVDLRLQPR